MVVSKMSDQLVKAEDSRPIGPAGHCTYCKEPIGSPHTWECVIPEKGVEIEITIRGITNVPRSWDAHDIEFYLNDGSNCIDNQINELMEKHGCLCPIAVGKYIGDVDEST